MHGTLNWIRGGGMTLDNFHFYGKHWEAEVNRVEMEIRLRQKESHDADEELQEAEIEESERRAAMTRERLRRWLWR
jgi:hypothetical protein